MIALVSIPSQLTDLPTSSIFFLKGCLDQENIQSTCYDMNHTFLTKYPEALGWCEFGLNYKDEYGLWIREYCNQLIDYEWIGLSIFTYNSQVFARKFLEILRPLTNAKIVLGGMGLTNSGSDVDVHSFNFGQDMIDAGLADYQIKGEGDISLPSLIKGRSYNFNQRASIAGLPIPNYDDINFNDYENKVVTVTGSRGCIRFCTFCDVNSIWPKYRYRPGKEIAEEISQMYHRYGINHVTFSDSLVNGSMKAFREFCNAMIEKNVPVTWDGMFIFRSGMTQNDWDIIKKSGCKSLFIGIESGSESVRKHMKKHFTNKCMYDSIDELGKREINMVFLMMVGYPTETENDFWDTLKLYHFARKYKHLVEVRTNIVMIVRGAPLYEDIKWYGHAETWRYVNSEGELTYAQRYERWEEAVRFVEECGLKQDRRIYQLGEVLKLRLVKERAYDHDDIKGSQIPVEQTLHATDSLILSNTPS